MSNTLKIIERVRSTTETGTNYAVAKALGMSPSNFMRVLNGKGYLGDQARVRAAKITGISLDDMVALVNEDKAHSEATKAYWRSLCSTRVRETLDIASKTAAAILVTLMLTTPQESAGSELHNYTLCAAFCGWLAAVARLRFRRSLRMNRVQLATRACPSVGTIQEASLPSLFERSVGKCLR